MLGSGWWTELEYQTAGSRHLCKHYHAAWRGEPGRITKDNTSHSSPQHKAASDLTLHLEEPRARHTPNAYLILRRIPHPNTLTLQPEPVTHTGSRAEFVTELYRGKT